MLTETCEIDNESIYTCPHTYCEQCGSTENVCGTCLYCAKCGDADSATCDECGH